MCDQNIDAKTNSCPLGGDDSASYLSRHGVQLIVSVSGHISFRLIDILVSEIMPKFSALPRGAMMVWKIGQLSTSISMKTVRLKVPDTNPFLPHLGDMIVTTL